MFVLKIEAYSTLIYVLQKSDYKENAAVLKAIQQIKHAIENHEQDVQTVLSYLDELLKPDTEGLEDDEFKHKLAFIKDRIEHINFDKTGSITRFKNPLKRLLDSLMAIKLLTQPTTLMMKSVSELSKGIINQLENYDGLLGTHKKAIDKFLEVIKNNTGPTEYLKAISLGSLENKPSRAKVIKWLKDASLEHLPEIMHIHFKFALALSKKHPLPTNVCREPIGAFKKIIDRYEPRGYKIYFENMADERINETYRAHIADTILYRSPLFTTDEKRGKHSELHYSNKTTTLGLMLDCQDEYESTFPTMPFAWVADAKAQAPDLKSRTTLDAIQNDALYVAGSSGMATLLLHLMENMGNFPTLEEKQSYLLAICAYIVGGGFHSFHEVLDPAAFSLELIPGYRVTPPDLVHHTRRSAPLVGEFFKQLSCFDEEFSALRERAWQHYFQCIDDMGLLSDIHARILQSIKLDHLLTEILRHRVSERDVCLEHYVILQRRAITDNSTLAHLIPLEDAIVDVLQSVSSPAVTSIKTILGQLRSTRGPMANQDREKANNIELALCHYPPEKRAGVLTESSNAVRRAMGDLLVTPGQCRDGFFAVSMSDLIPGMDPLPLKTTMTN